tara:strand:+ start:211 stop:648 length:438 start_codon:yes stop_codon:yes gene_type:complete
MNILFNIILIYFFLFIAFIIGVPGTNKYNIIQNKLILFIGIFLLQFILLIINKITNNCKVPFKKLAQHSIYNSLISVIAYSIYIDLITMNTTKEYMNSVIESKYLRAGLLSAIISSSLFVNNFFRIIIGSDSYKCRKSDVKKLDF